MSRLIDDESGKVLSGYFYVFEVPLDGDDLGRLRDDSWVVAKRPDRRGSWVWCEVIREDEQVARKCRRDPTHVISRTYGKRMLDVNGGGQFSEFVPDSTSLHVLVSEEFAATLRASSFSGLDLREIPINVNQSSWDKPKVLHASFQEVNCLRPRIIEDGPNACPFCGASPVVCPECGNVNYRCTKCMKELVVAENRHDGQGDKRLRASPPSKLGRVIDGSHWHGIDFFETRGIHFVTKRVVDWLLSIHAAPFVARPARVRVNDMTEAQLKVLEETKRFRMQTQ